MFSFSASPSRPSHFTLSARALILAAVGSVTLTLAACGGGGGGSSGEVVRTPPNKPTYGVGEGENAKMETISQINPTNTYFGKRYNRPNLEGVLRASGTETVKYVQALTVSPYRVMMSDDDAYFSMLPAVTKDLRKVWDSASGGISGGTLAGLYFDACGFTPCQRSAFMPTILVANTSTRWVIVHEMMHHLFNVQRKRDGTPNSSVAGQRLQDSANKIQSYLDSFKEYNDRTYLQMAADEFANTIALAKLALASSKLEETTVERVLVDEWAADRLVYVDLEMAANAVWYMKSNAESALAFDAQLNDAMNEMIKLADDSNSAAVKVAITKDMADLSAFDDSVKQTVLDAAAIVKDKLASKKATMQNPTLASQVLQLSHPFAASAPKMKTSCLEDHHELEKTAAILEKISAH